jgi:hypothetical protein
MADLLEFGRQYIVRQVERPINHTSDILIMPFWNVAFLFLALPMIVAAYKSSANRHNKTDA